MLKTEQRVSPRGRERRRQIGRVVVIWIDWYAYHVARFRGLVENPSLGGEVVGIELVGSVGVHAGLKFRDDLPAAMPIETLFPDHSWSEIPGWKMALALWKRLNKLNPEVVLVPGYYTLPGIAAALWGKLHGRRTVLMTESTEADHRRLPAREILKSWLMRSLFDWAVAGGTPHKRYLERLRFPLGRVGGYYDVVDNEYFRLRSLALKKHSTAADFDLPEQYFLYVGRLAEEKNLCGLLDSYLEYRRAGGHWSLVLVGDGPERKRLEHLAAIAECAEDIHFPGLKTTAELPQYYAFAGCFVLPSSREPWGLVVNEAMASGLPIIVSHRCGCAEDLLREGENGCSFDPMLAGDLTACLTAIGNLDQEFLAHMGQCSQEIISQFSPEAWAAEVARIVKA